MYWEEIRQTEHFQDFHYGTLAWSEIIRRIYTIKSKRKKGNKIEIEDDQIYILCELKDKTLYVINVKRKQ